tara:strand:+ start:475 stop:1062 length:588 start_codon:yes stop_codon:yes gene_type:complete
LRKFSLTIIILFFWNNSIAQTDPVIVELRTDFGIENLDLRFRPIFYFISKKRMRREVFLGYTINKTTKLFSYSRYNDYENKFYTGFRYDKKIYFTDKLSLNNQFRYLSSPSDKNDNDIGIYIPDLLYNLKNVSFGLRGFIINRIESLEKISISKPFIGPAIIMKEDRLMTMITLLPDVNQKSNDYLLMALFILKL